MTLTKTLSPAGVLVSVNGNDLKQPQVIEDIVDEIASVGGDIPDGAVDTAQLADGAVASAKLDTNIQVEGTFGVPNALSTFYHTRLTGYTRVDGAVSVTLASGNNDDVAIGALATANRINITSDAGGSTLRGIETTGLNGQLLFCKNIGGALTIKHNDAGSVAANRFSTPGGTDFAVAANGLFILMYDTVAALWLVK